VKNVSGVYSCTCAAWKFQSKPIDRRTCRHILEIRGEAAESQRLKREVQQIARLRPKGGMPGVLLAHKYTEGNDVVGWWMSEKLDGVSIVCVCFGGEHLLTTVLAGASILERY